MAWRCGSARATPARTSRRGEAGRDFVRTLSGIWRANGCLTSARSRALHAHLASLQARPKRPQPGSYAWPELRHQVESAYAEGHRPQRPGRLHPHHLRHLSSPSTQPAHPRTLGSATALAHPAAALAPRDPLRQPLVADLARIRGRPLHIDCVVARPLDRRLADPSSPPAGTPPAACPAPPPPAAASARRPPPRSPRASRTARATPPPPSRRSPSRPGSCRTGRREAR